MRAINPANGQVLQDYRDHGPPDVQDRLIRAVEAFAEWRTLDLRRRADILRHLAAQVRHDAGRLAQLMTEEMGKPIRQSQAEIEKCAWVCDYYAEHGETFLKFEPVATEARRSGVQFEPLGPILAVMPWNFPFWQLFRCAVPAVMAGNVVLLKHASNVPGCAMAIEDVWRTAGAPAGVVTALLVGSRQLPPIVEHPAVRAVSLTGSEAAGRSIAELAGRNLKKCVLELGGADPFIVLEDADLSLAASQAAAARCINSGQSCIAAKRFLVVQSRIDDFQEALVAHMERQQVGDPMQPDTQIGPLAREDLVQEVERQVQESLHQGARLLTGGNRLDRPGFFYAPTVLADVTPPCPAFREEVFGPVAAVTSVRDVEQAVEMANLSPYGLGASIWTRDLSAAERLAGRLETGMVFVNQIVKSDPRLPFGGVKNSGYGRELARDGIREMTNLKTLWIA